MAKKKEEIIKEESASSIRYSAGFRFKGHHLSIIIQDGIISGILLDNETLKGKTFTATLKEV